MMKVQLYMYDMSKGKIWYTSIVVRGREFSYNCIYGIQESHPRSPMKIVELGETSPTWAELKSFIDSLKRTQFAAGAYDELENNCNNFSNMLSEFLCGRQIFEDIMQTAAESHGYYDNDDASWSSSSSSSGSSSLPVGSTSSRRANKLEPGCNIV